MKLLAVVVKELTQLKRDPRSLVMIAMIPLIVMLLFGVGYGGGMGKIGIAVVKLDKGSLSWTVLESIMRTPSVYVKAYANSIEEGRNMVQDGIVSAAVVIPEGFTDELMKGSSTQVFVIVDESITTISSTIRNAMLAVTYQFQQELVRSVQGSSVELIYSSVYGPRVTNLEAFTPLVIGIVLQLVPTTLISIAICKEKEKGTFEQLIMSPISRFDIIFGKLLAFFVATIADMLITLMVAVWVFDVSVRGALVDAMAISALFLLGSLGLGMLISVLSRNQLQANQAAIFIFIPALLFSGALMPIEMLSPSARLLANLTPMYYFVSAFRDVMIKGFGLWEITWQLSALSIYMILMMAMAPMVLRLRVD
ncbi:MAG: ABC transporter permease [Candidatus Methanomethylicaceae archaeon]